MLRPKLGRPRTQCDSPTMQRIVDSFLNIIDPTVYALLRGRHNIVLSLKDYHNALN